MNKFFLYTVVCEHFFSLFSVSIQCNKVTSAAAMFLSWSWMVLMFLQCLFITKQLERIFTMKTWAPCIVWPAVCFSIPDLSYKVSLLHVIIQPLGQTCLPVWRSMYEKFKMQFFEHHCKVRPRCHFRHERNCLTTFQTLRGELKIRCAVEYVWRTSRT